MIEMGVRHFGCSIFRNCGRDSFPGQLDSLLAAVMHLVSLASSNLQVNRFYQATDIICSQLPLYGGGMAHATRIESSTGLETSPATEKLLSELASAYQHRSTKVPYAIKFRKQLLRKCRFVTTSLYC